MLTFHSLLRPKETLYWPVTSTETRILPSSSAEASMKQRRWLTHHLCNRGFPNLSMIDSVWSLDAPCFHCIFVKASFREIFPSVLWLMLFTVLDPLATRISFLGDGIRRHQLQGPVPQAASSSRLSGEQSVDSVTFVYSVFTLMLIGTILFLLSQSLEEVAWMGSLASQESSALLFLTLCRRSSLVDSPTISTKSRWISIHQNYSENSCRGITETEKTLKQIDSDD